MPVKDIKIGYNSLRAIVVALHTHGSLLKGPGLTFSHGNYGNELLKLADHFDNFVVDLEPRHELVLMKMEDLEETLQIEARLSEQHRRSQANKFVTIPKDVARRILLTRKGEPRRKNAASREFASALTDCQIQELTDGREDF